VSSARARCDARSRPRRWPWRSRRASDARRQQALAEERLNLITNPSIYLDTSELKYLETGGEDAWQLVAVTVTNRSHFHVRDLEGDVTWIDEQGRRFAKTPFTMKGMVAAGNDNTFSLEAGTLTSGTQKGAVVSAAVAFTKVSLGE
jgi:hypothetical protein